MFSFSSFGVISPSSLKLKVYQVAFALNDDCSNPRVIFTSTTGVESDFLSAPIIGSGPLDDGTYNCVMITMSDVIKYTAATNEGLCVAGTEYSGDLCRNQASSGGIYLQSHTDLLEGTTTTATECLGTSSGGGAGGVSNKVTMYLRTSGVSFSDPNASYVTSWMKGTAAIGAAGGGNPTSPLPNGGQLSSPFVKSGLITGIFYADASNFLDGSGGYCELTGAKFGFRNP